MKILQDVSSDHHIAKGLKESNEIEFADWGDLKMLVFSFYIIKAKYDVFHLQFLQYRFYSRTWSPFSIPKLVSFLLNILIIKLFGVSVVWTAHHSKSHETPSPWLDYQARQIIIKLCDHIFVLEPPVKEQLEYKYEVNTSVSVTRLGNYREFHKDRDSGDASGNEIPPKPTVSILGYLRVYKRVPLGLTAADESKHTDGFIVAGRPQSTEIKQQIMDKISDVSIEVSSSFGFVSDTDLLTYVDNSVAILILNEQETVPATAHLAISSETPIITVPGGVKEYLVEEYGVGLVANSDDIKDISNAIDELIEREINPDWQKYNKDHQWHQYREDHLVVYKRLTQK